MQVLDLNDQPLANSYLKNKTDDEETFPLKLNFCNECTHLQLSYAVDPDKLFKNYLYVSGTSETLRNYFKDFVIFAAPYSRGVKVLDIACNDGSQLDAFKERGFQTYGIDPAENLYPISSKNHNIVCDYLTYTSIDKFNTKFDFITAQNVFAHNSYPEEFLNICKSRLANGGRIFIQTSQANMVKNNEFDTIYHEHLSFFSVQSFCTLAKRVGLKIINVSRNPIHGTSFIFVLSNDESDIDKSDYFIEKESQLNSDVMKNYAISANKITVDLKNVINSYKESGFTVVGFGAAAKGNTLLNFGKISLDYIVDDNSLKQNLYTPGMRIEIKSPDVLKQEDPKKLLIVPLAWNFYSEIRNKTLTILNNSDVKFLKYFPSIEIL
jgi:2-polyprenyl-3-methyl-5-hydroxy-6-metoxy-1,4-benzoquinol methylase